MRVRGVLYFSKCVCASVFVFMPLCMGLCVRMCVLDWARVFCVRVCVCACGCVLMFSYVRACVL